MTTVEYPARFESDVVLRTGRTVHIRPVRTDDHERLIAFYARLSPESLHARFFGVCRPEVAAAASPSTIDYDREFGAVAELGGEIAGVAHYFTSRRFPNVAEVAFAISDAAQGCGAGTKLLETLIAAARDHGIDRFEAEVLPENRRMLDVFLSTGFDVVRRTDEGTVHLEFPIAATAVSAEQAAGRSQQAAYASMRAVFAPHSIAVVGASRRPGQLGREIVHNLSTSGYAGGLYVVNPHAVEVEGIRAHASLRDIAESVELAIIAVPAHLVDSVLDDCIAIGVAAVVVISAGFAEVGDEGRTRQAALVEKIRRPGFVWSVRTAWA